MATLSHPNIVTVHEAGETLEGLLYFTMEYVGGTDVAALLAQQGRLSPQEALRITTAVCAALECAHAHGIIHRDIKPSNVLINEHGEVKVADFGLAKIIAADSGLTQTMATVGTPDFLAPESYIQGIALDERADIYSTGVMLYKMLTGYVPRGRFDAPSGQVRDLDPRLDGIIDKAMQADRDKRYATAKEMRLALEQFAASATAKQPVAKKPAARRPVYRTIITAAALLALAFGGYSTWLKARSVSAASGSAATTRSAEAWVDLLQPSATPKLTLDGIEKAGADGLVVPPNGKATVTGTDGPGHGDGALRFRARFEVVAKSRLSIRARYSQGQAYALMVLNPTKVALQLWSRDGTAKTLSNFLLNNALQPGQDYELELRAVGSTLTARLDGKTLGQVEDTTIPQGAFMIGLGVGQPVTIRALEYLDLSAPDSTGASLVARNTSAAISSLLWTKAFSDLSKLPNLAEFTDGWARLSGSDGIRHIDDDAGNSLTLHNGGLRVKRRVQEKWHGGVLLHVRSQDGGRRLNLCYYEPKAPGELAHLQLRDFRSETLPPGATAAQAWDAQKLLAEQRIPRIGTEIIAELVVVGTTLVGRVGDHSITCTVEDTGKPGRLAIDEADTQFFRDVEVVNLDGMPEADALKLLGINGDAGKSKGASSSATSADASTARWMDAFAESPLKEVIAESGRSSQGYRLPDNQHWPISALSRGTGALRVRATSSGEKFVSIYIDLGNQLVERVRFRSRDGKWLLSRGTVGTEEVEFAAKSGLSPLDGQPHELLFSRVGGRVLTTLDGQLLHDEADTSATDGKFVLDVYPDAEIFVDKVEHLDLEGVSEAEALRLLGIEKK